MNAKETGKGKYIVVLDEETKGGNRYKYLLYRDEKVLVRETYKKGELTRTKEMVKPPVSLPYHNIDSMYHAVYGNRLKVENKNKWTLVEARPGCAGKTHNLYVNRDGVVVTETVDKEGAYIKQQVLCQKVDADGYLKWSAFNWGETGTEYSSLVHRFIAQVFFPDFDEELTVTHLNGDKQDNRVSNLKLGTRLESHGYQAALRAEEWLESEQGKRMLKLIQRGYTLSRVAEQLDMGVSELINRLDQTGLRGLRDAYYEHAKQREALAVGLKYVKGAKVTDIQKTTGYTDGKIYDCLVALQIPTRSPAGQKSPKRGLK